MSSNDKQVVENTRERWLSTDFNDNNALIYANIADYVAAVGTGEFSAVATTNRGGILAGGLVTANGVTLDIEISPLLGFKVGPPPGPFDSRYLKIQTIEPTAIDLTVFVDPGNPKWVAIEVAPGQIPEVVSSRDIFQPALGTFTPQNVPKITGPQPVFTVNEGVAAPNPQLPLGNPDVVPLAYIYLEAGASAVNGEDIVWCRPQFLSARNFQEFTGRGGVEVDDQIGAGTYLCKPQPITVTPFGRPTLAIDQGLGPIQPTIIDVAATNDPNFAQGEAFPAGADARIGVWFSPAPYPPGYDADVRNNREFRAFGDRIPSVPTGTNNGYTANGVFVFSAVSQGALDNFQGNPEPAILAINDSTWNGGTLDPLATYYVGSVANYQVGTSLYPQRLNAPLKGVIYFSQPLIGGNQNLVGSSATTVVNARTADYFPAGPVGPEILPNSVFTVQWFVSVERDGPPNNATRVAISETGLASATFGLFYENVGNTASAPPTNSLLASVIDVYLDGIGAVEVENQAPNPGVASRLSIRLRSYIDSILAKR